MILFRTDEYQLKANWSPESSVRGGFDDRDVQDIHDIHEMPELQGKKLIETIETKQKSNSLDYLFEFIE